MAIKKLDLLRVITSSNYLYNFSSSYSNKAKTASYALNASGGGGSSLRTGSTYPITASYANRAITASYALNASGGGSSLAGAQTFVSNGSQTIYTLNQSVVNRDQILVVTNGVVQSRTGSNYTVSGTTLTLSEAVQSGGLVDVRYINAGQGSSGTSGTSGGASTLGTGSTYPITSSYARKAITASYLTTISQSLIPAKNNVYSLGSPTKKWKDIYVSTASIYFDNFPLRVVVKNNSPQLLFNTSSIVTVPSGSNPSTSSYATKALTASYALNASGGGGSTLNTGSTYPITSSFARRAITASYALNTFFQTGSIVKQTLWTNVTSGSSNTISGLSLGGNKWDVSVVEEWDAAVIDQYYNSCSFLSHFDTLNSAGRFIDNSSNNLVITSSGNVTINTDIYKFGGGSAYFDGNGDYLSTNNSNNLAFGTGDFTVEFWIYSSDVSSAQRGFLQTSDTSGGLKTSYTSGIIILQGSNNVGANLNGGISANIAGTSIGSSTAVVTTNTWYHIALVRNAGTSTLYVNGTSVGSGTTTGNCSGTYLAIGGYYNTSYLYQGYLDELRITKGVARYTSNFTPPSNPFPNSRAQIATRYVGIVGGINDKFADYGVQKLSDSSLLVRKLTAVTTPVYGSGSLSASIDRVYVNVLDYTKVAVTSSYASRALTASYALNASGGGGSTLRTGSTYPITSSFARRAITASYALNTFFQTGSIVKQTLWTNVTSGSSNTISGLSLGGNKWDVSVVEEWDAAVLDQYYNSCSLLCHFDTLNPTGRFIDNSRNNFVITSSGNVSVNTYLYKFGGGSAYFDGTGDLLFIPTSNNFGFGTGDFTIEFWVYLNSTATQTLVSCLTTSTSIAPHLYILSGGSIRYYTNSADRIVGSNLVVSTWYFVTITRSGTSTKMFIDGVQVGSTYTDNNNYGTSNPFIIADYGSPTTGTNQLNGYIDELRITKGVARYTANFTPPNAPFPNSRNQVLTKYVGLVGGIDDKYVDYGVQKLSDSSLKLTRLTYPNQPNVGSGSLSGSVSRVYVNVLDYTKVAVTSSYSLLSKTASYALNASGGGSTLRTGSTYPITASYASGGGTMSNGRVYGMTLLFS